LKRQQSTVTASSQTTSEIESNIDDGSEYIYDEPEYINDNEPVLKVPKPEPGIGSDTDIITTPANSQYAKKAFDKLSALERVAWDNLITSQTTIKATEKRTLELQT